MLINYCNSTKKENIYEKAGVYQYQCQPENSTECNVQCNKKYIGFTSRSFKHRYIEHTKYSQHSNPNSTVAKHIKLQSYEYGLIQQHLTVLKTCKDKIRSNIYEQYRIYKHMKEEGHENLLKFMTDFKNHITFEILRQNQHSVIS